MDAFDVYRKNRNGKSVLIDTVFANKGAYTANEMRESLINHDGYPYDITVRKARRS